MKAKLKSVNLNINGRDLCMAGRIIFNCILIKEERRTLTHLIWGLLVGCKHSEDNTPGVSVKGKSIVPNVFNISTNNKLQISYI